MNWLLLIRIYVTLVIEQVFANFTISPCCRQGDVVKLAHVFLNVTLSRYFNKIKFRKYRSHYLRISKADTEIVRSAVCLIIRNL